LSIATVPPAQGVRGRGESYSDVIVRLAKGDGGEE
jgi:hypothetical protein